MLEPSWRRRLPVRLGAVALVTVTAASVLPSVALAGQKVASGEAVYNALKYTENGIMTKNGTSNVYIDYYNGIGSGGNDLLWLRLSKTDGTPFADSRAITEHNTTTWVTMW